MTTEPAKAHGNAAAATTTSISIPPTGEEAQISLDSMAGSSSITSGSGTSAAVAENKNRNNRLILRHGSSLRLIATVCSFLADPAHSDNFSYIDPNGDQGKWKRKGMDLYYCAVMEPTTNSILCLTSLSLLLKNAMAEEPGGRRRRIRIANPNVRQRVFAVGGDHAMDLLQCAGFELGVDEEGDATLTFRDGANEWLTAAVDLLQEKAT